MYFFADGVTESGMAGAAVMCPDLKLKLFYKLPNGLSIYYVEAYAILKALKFVTDSLFENFVIISDSSCVLQDIKSSIHITSPHPFIITQICHELTKFKHGQSSLKWMPGEKKHNILCTIDRMAKQATVNRVVEQIDYTTSEASLMVNECVWKWWEEEWISNPSCEYQKLFAFSKKSITWNIPRYYDTIISKVRLLQSKLNSGLFKIGLHETGLCDHCGVFANSQHFIMDCLVTLPLRAYFRNYINQVNKQWTFQSLITDQHIMTLLAKFVIDNHINV